MIWRWICRWWPWWCRHKPVTLRLPIAVRFRVIHVPTIHRK